MLVTVVVIATSFSSCCMKRLVTVLHVVMYAHSTLKMGDDRRSHCRIYGCLNRYYPSASCTYRHIFMSTPFFKEHFANLICDSS